MEILERRRPHPQHPQHQHHHHDPSHPLHHGPALSSSTANPLEASALDDASSVSTASSGSAAPALLTTNPATASFAMEVHFRNHPSLLHLNTDEGRWFERFVRALAGNVRLERLRLVGGKFVTGVLDDGGVVEALDPDNTAHNLDGVVPLPPPPPPTLWRNESLEQLLQFALPCHASLTKIGFYQCHLAPYQLDLLGEALGQRRPSSLPALQLLSFESVPFGRCGANAVARLLHRNPTLDKLEVSSCGIGTHGCRSILMALPSNTRLRALKLMYNDVEAVDVQSIAAMTHSNVKRFTFRDDALSSDAYTAFAMGLRSNDTLEELYLSQYGGIQVPIEPFETLLHSFAVSLKQIRINGTTPPTLVAALDCNSSIRAIRDNLVARNYSVDLCADNDRTTNNHTLLPKVLSHLSSKPSLLYHTLRRGTLEQFAAAVRGNANTTTAGVITP